MTRCLVFNLLAFDMCSVTKRQHDRAYHGDQQDDTRHLKRAAVAQIMTAFEATFAQTV